MQPGTSPAVAVQPDGTFEVAFQANTHVLWVVDGKGVGHSTGLGMDPGSSPSITALPAGGFEVAFQANTHALWSVDQNGVGHVVNGAIMTAGSSPSINAYVPLQGSTTSTAQLSMVEQQVGSGPIPFAGQYPPLGMTRSGHVDSITYPASGFLDSSLLFVKTGHSTADCNDPSAVVALPEGRTTTPDQLAAIFGTMTPSFSPNHPLQAAACFSGPNPTPSFINLPITVQFD